MNGKVIVGGLVSMALIAGAGLWYSLQHGFYEEVSGVTEISVRGQILPVEEYRGIDGDSSPLKLRACLRTAWRIPDEPEARAEAAPLTAPGWFSCYDAEQIARDLVAGRANVMAIAINEPFGFTTYLARYPDGRAFLWRQINACGEADFNGDDLPEGCVEDASTTTVPAGDGAVQTGQPLDNVVMTLTPAGGGTAEEIPADDLQVVSANALPQSLWACFRVINSIPMLTETYEVADQADPVAPPVEFACFDAPRIASDLQDGTALAFLGARDVWPGVDRMVAIYDDGRAFAWHQPRN